MGIYLGSTEISPKIGSTEVQNVYIGNTEIWSNFVAFEKSFAYTGGVQSLTIPYNGLYLLEVWGARAGQSKDYYGTKKYGGNGGYSKGYKVFNKGDVVYIVVGQAGGDWVDSNFTRTAYNGGGKGHSSTDINTGSGGGGATHMATVTGLLSAIGYTNFVTNKKGLIVAGGGGGNISAATGGAGGGTTGGGNGGGTQTSGYAFGRGEDATATGSYSEIGGGGGGLYGGQKNGPAGGGSGYIGGVPAVTYKGVTYSPSTTAGQWDGGNGKAKITRIA